MTNDKKTFSGYSEQTSVPDLKPALHETPEAFKQRIGATMDCPVPAGTATLLKEKYDVESGILPVNAVLRDWVKPLLAETGKKPYLQIECALAKFLLKPASKYSLFVHLKADGNRVKAGGIELYTRNRSFPVYGYDTDRMTFRNSLGMRFTLISPGAFMMGSAEEDEHAYENELPRHRVEIAQPFFLGVYPVTQAQWMSVMDDNPSVFEGTEHPVDTVNFFDAKRFLDTLNRQEQTYAYRLPSEAEWEYAARAGTETLWYFGDDVSDLAEYAWHEGNSSGKSHPVGQKNPNAWGLYDMHGNVWEWTKDLYGKKYYRNSPVRDPKGPDSGDFRVMRGGSWYNWPRGTRTANRLGGTPANRSSFVGFRIAYNFF